MKKRLLLDAAPFCYGPISTLLAVVEPLLHDDFEATLLASGTALEFAQPYADRLTLVPCNTESIADLSGVRDTFDHCDLFVCNTNPAGAAFAASQGIPTVYIDTLFWMWDHIPEACAQADIYIAQDFAGVDRNLAAFGADIRNFQRVGPLIAAKPNAETPGERDNIAVISYGGMESSLTIPGRSNRLHEVQTRLLLDVLADQPTFDELFFCGRGHVMQDLARRYDGPGKNFGFVEHKRFLALLRRARVCFTSPGLTGAYEVVDAGIPTCFLLPQNYSQQLQAAHFVKDPAWPLVGVEWGMVYEDGAVPQGMGEAEAVALLNRIILRFEQDAAAQQTYRDLLAQQLTRLSQPTPITPLKSGIDAAARLIATRAQQITDRRQNPAGVL